MIETLTLELTLSCNLRCVHCFQERHNRYLNRGIAEAVIDRADSLGASQVVLTGGEPTLHPEFEAIYRFARESGYIVNLFTNGMKYRPGVWECFQEMPPHITSLTLYGVDGETFKNVTGRRGSFEEPIETARRLKELGVDVWLRYNAITLTYESVGKFVELADSLGCSYSVNVQIIPRINGEADNLVYRLSGEQVLELEAKYDFDFTPDDPVLSGKCDLGENLYITSSGMIQGCPIFESVSEVLSLDNIEEQISRIVKAGDYMRKNRALNRGVCPAWLHLEGPGRVKEFLEEIGAKGL